jgi:Ca2+-binding RTX toxin-like protein
VTITGRVAAGYGGVSLGGGVTPGDRLYNSGTITAGTQDDATADARYHNGVYTEGDNTRIFNLPGGTITANGATAAGVRVGFNGDFGGDGTVVTNAGTIISANAWGVDFSGLHRFETARLINTGTLQGAFGAFIGNGADERMTNRGTMIGDVDMGEGNDTLDGRGGTFIGNILAGDGNNFLDLRGDSHISGAIYGGTSTDTIEGGNGNETILSDAGEDRVFGFAGNDTIVAGDNDDFLVGGAGDDVLFGGTGFDGLYGGDGNDTLIDEGTGGLMSGGAGNDNLVLGNNASTGFTFLGGEGLDTITGGDNADSLFGGQDADQLSGGLGADQITGGGGDDLLQGRLDNDTLFGGGGDDALDGAENRDSLVGGAGNDTLIGGAASDTMTGGQGTDDFVFASSGQIGTAAGSRDVIVDFRVGTDLIVLTDIDASTLVAGNQGFTFIGSGAFTNVAAQLRYVTVDGTLSGDTNGDGAADFVLELLNRPTGLSAADILL